MQVEGQSVWNRTAPISRDKWHHITWQLYYFGWRKTRPAPTCSACGRGLRWHVCSWCRWCCMVWIINVFHVMWFKAVVLCEDESCFENAAKINSPRAVLLLKHHDPKLCVFFFFTLWSIQTPRNRALRHVEDTRAVEARTRKQYYRKRVTSRFNKQGFYFFAYGQEEEHTTPRSPAVYSYNDVCSCVHIHEYSCEDISLWAGWFERASMLFKELFTQFRSYLFSTALMNILSKK